MFASTKSCVSIDSLTVTFVNRSENEKMSDEIIKRVLCQSLIPNRGIPTINSPMGNVARDGKFRSLTRVERNWVARDLVVKWRFSKTKCLDELLSIHQFAITFNDGKNFTKLFLSEAEAKDKGVTPIVVSGLKAQIIEQMAKKASPPWDYHQENEAVDVLLHVYCHHVESVHHIPTKAFGDNTSLEGGYNAMYDQLSTITKQLHARHFLQ